MEDTAIEVEEDLTLPEDDDIIPGGIGFVPDEKKVEPPKPKTQGGAPKKEAPPIPKVLKAKINGKEEDVTEEKIRQYLKLDPDEIFDDKRHVKFYQQQRDLDLRYNDVGRTKNELEQIRQALASPQGFEQFLREAGVDPDEFAFQRMQQREALQQMSPEQQIMLQRQQELAQREEAIQRYEQHQQQIRHQEEVTHHYNNYVGSMAKELAKGGIPQDPTLLAMAADHIEAQMQRGRKDISFQEAAKYTMDKFQNSSRNIMTKMEGEKLIEFLGKDIIRKIRETLVKQPKGLQQQGKVGQIPISNTVNQKPAMSREQYLADVQRRMKE